MSSSAAASIGFVHPAALPAKSSTFSSSSSLLGAAVVVSVIKASFVLSSAVPASFSLLAHACAGALGGLAALFSETAVSKGLGEAQQESIRHAIKFTTISKAVNSVTFAYISQAMAALGSGGVMVAAAGTGVIATAVQSLFSKQNRKDFIRDNVARNVFVFEAFWMTYAGICALSPAFSISYTGLAVAGGLSGIASTVASSVNLSCKGGLRGALRRFRQGYASIRASFKGSSRAALQSSVLFVVYQAVYTTLVLV